MARFFARLQKVFQAEANTVVSRLEDPIKLTEQGVRDLKSNLSEAVISLAQVKSVAIRMRKEADEEKGRADAYERKAVALVQRGKVGELELAEADRLGREALRLKTDAEGRYLTLAQGAIKQEALVTQLQGRIEALRHDIGRYESELVTLRARVKTASSVRKINQHLSGADSSDTVALLERMREKVAEEEALAEAYEQLESTPRSLEREIDRALRPQASALPPEDSLVDLKARMAIAEDDAKR